MDRARLLKAQYRRALDHPEPIPMPGRLLQGVGWGLLLAAPLWALIVGLVLLVRRVLGA